MRSKLATVLFGLTLATACSQTDAGITTSVKTKFASDDLVKARNINVDTQGGVVTLTGYVQNAQEEAKALQIAREQRGVTNVVDHLEIEPPAAPTTGSDRLTGDPGITAEIKTKMLADTSVAGLKIDVDTKDGVVTLTGNLASQAEKARALEIARGVTGVTRVEDKLTVGSK